MQMRKWIYVSMVRGSTFNHLATAFGVKMSQPHTSFICWGLRIKLWWRKFMERHLF